MNKKILSVVNNNEDPNKFDVSYKFIDPTMIDDEPPENAPDEESNLETVSIEEIFQSEVPIEKFVLAENSFSNLQIEGKLEIPEGVTVIPENCFEGSKFTTLSLPSTIESIEHLAFYSTTIDTPLYIKNAKIFSEPIGEFDLVNDPLPEIILVEESNLETISIAHFAFRNFKGIIYTDNNESKDQFLLPSTLELLGDEKFSGRFLEKKQVVNLSSREECFKALKNKTFQEIHQLEDDLGRKILDKDYLNTIDKGIIILYKDRQINVNLNSSSMTLSDAAKLKKIMLDDSKTKIISGNSMFDQPFDNKNKDPEKTNENNPSKGNS